jgi:hypothetical protein
MVTGWSASGAAAPSRATSDAALQIACDSGESARSNDGGRGTSCSALTAMKSSAPKAQIRHAFVGCAVFVRSRMT